MQWPLVGRDRELRAVDELLELGGAGVVIVGSAGVGKTRLGAEVGRLARQRDYVVEWVSATRSAAHFPLGSFASLIPPGLGEEGELLARARRALGRHADGRRLALCIDDAHLLDDASAVLVHQLVIAGEAFVAVMLRRDADASDALRALWKDELCPLLELEALERADTVRLLGGALGGPVDGPTVNALWELTHGNALFLRELVLYGLDRSALERVDGIWRWRGAPAVGARLGELVEARLEGVPGRDVLELLSVGAPLEVDLLQRSEEDSLDALERSGLVVRRLDGRRRSVDVAHPLHGEAVRAHLSVTRSEAIQRRLADAVEAVGARRAGDMPRLAAWRLAAGGGARELFEGAAEHALAALDFASAERFARAAGGGASSGGFRAGLGLGRALAGAGRADEAESVLGGLTARSDDERSSVAIARARNLFWALDRAADATAVLEQARAAVSSPAAAYGLVAHRVRLAAAAGRPAEALAVAVPLIDDDAAHEPARVVAVTAAVEALLSAGRTGEAIALTERWEPVAARQPEAVPPLDLLLRSERAFALRFAGRLIDATELAEHNYCCAVQRRSAATTAVEAVSLGFLWLARGQVARALRFCREGAALLRDADPAGMLPWALAGVAQAAAHAGRADAARDAVVELERLTLGHTAFAFELGVARAWSATGDGEHTRARRLAAETSDGAAALGQHASALRAAHELCRLGGAAEAAPRLAGLARRVDGQFAPLAAAHAQALAAGDGSALVSVADSFAGLDALLLAAEAASGAAVALRDEGRADSARAASARSSAWLGRCDGARPPTILAPAVSAELTAREREIAALAAGGLTSREIADRLVVSVRTVDNHLQRVYRKLGVSRRGQLSRLLT